MNRVLPDVPGWKLLLKGACALSLLLNLGLAVPLFFGAGPVREVDDGQPIAASPVPRGLGKSTHRMERWSDVESSSQGELAKRLRRIGCPERFVRNAVVADIDRVFHGRRLELVENRNEELAVRQRAFLELSEERRDVIEATLGIDAASAPSKDWGGLRRSKVIAGFFSFLDPEHAERAYDLYWRALRYGRWNKEIAGALSPEEVAAFRQDDYDTFRAKVGEFMTAEQQYESELRFYANDFFDVWSSENQFGRSLDRAEADEMVRILMPSDYWASSFLLPLESTNDETVRAKRLRDMTERFGVEVVEHFRDFESRLSANAVFPKK